MAYSKKKFLQFTVEKQKKTVFQQAQHCLDAWDTSARDDAISSLKELLFWMDIPAFQALRDAIVPALSLYQFDALINELRQKEMPPQRDYDFVIYSRDKSQTSTGHTPVILVLDNLRSAFNVGSIVRTAECFNVEKVYFCGYTPTPQSPQVKKTAMGTDAWVSWEKSPHTAQVITALQQDGYTVYALETTSNALDINITALTFPCAFVLGNEALGLAPETIAFCNTTLRIPLQGKKNSLNVGVSAAIACYEAQRQRQSI